MSNKRQMLNKFDRTGSRKKARFRFRVIVRAVMANRQWLTEVGEQKISGNYKKNIEMLVRKTEKKVGLLTLNDKILIRKAQENRTIDDRRKLVHLFAGLDCLAFLPPKVRARLVRVAKFAQLEPGKVLIREGGTPMTVYFILSGEVEASIKVYKPLEKVYSGEVLYISGPGDVIGDIDLVENRERRKHTFTVTKTTEVLIVYDDDFDRILRPVMSQQWLNKKKAIKAFDYFNMFDEEQIETACRLGIVTQFAPLELICYEDLGPVSYVHFILSGECMILQRLRVKVKEYGGEKLYKLITVSPDAKIDFDGPVTLINQLRRATLTPIDAANLSEFTVASENIIKQIEEEDSQRTRQKAEEDIKKIEYLCRHPETAGHLLGKSKSYHSQRTYRSIKSDKSHKEKKSKTEKVLKIDELVGDEVDRASIKATTTYRSLYDYDDAEENETDIPRSSVRREEEEEDAGEDEPLRNSISYKSMDLSMGDKQYREQQQERRREEEQRWRFMERLRYMEETENSIAPETSSTSTETEATSSSGISFSSDELKTRPKTKSTQGGQKVKLENHFFDVGSLYHPGVFGLGEELVDRIIGARTQVQCLLLPRFWLFEKAQNTSNAWGRRRFYLESNIPSRMEIYENFLKTHKWQTFKTEYVESNIKHFIGNPTKKEDIPIIGHIIGGL